jgi:hypothetical protein
MANPLRVEAAIETNRQLCKPLRATIRKWIVDNWDMETFLKDYVEELRKYL